MNTKQTVKASFASMLCAVALVGGCLLEEQPGDHEAGAEDPPVVTQQKKDTPPAGTACHVGRGGAHDAYDGTMDSNGACCGYARCNDPVVCGPQFGQKLLWCEQCHDEGVCSYPRG